MKKSFRKLGMATAMVLTMVGFAACGDDEATRMGGEEDETTTENKGESENYIQTKGEFLGEFYNCDDVKHITKTYNGTEPNFAIDTVYESLSSKVVVMKLSDKENPMYSNKYLYLFQSSLFLGDYQTEELNKKVYTISTKNIEIGKRYYIYMNDTYNDNPNAQKNCYIMLTSESTFEIHYEYIGDRPGYVRVEEYIIYYERL